MARPPNIILLGIDSLSAGHLSSYGYHRHTSPHLDRFAADAVLFERTFSPAVPTTPAYCSMLSGLDCFSTQVVALRHRGPLGAAVTTLPELLRGHGYTSTCVGFSGNPSRAASTPTWTTRRGARTATVAPPRRTCSTRRRCRSWTGWWRAATRSCCSCATWTRTRPTCRRTPTSASSTTATSSTPNNRSMDPVKAFKPFRDYFAAWMPPAISDKDYVIAQYDGAIAYMDAAIAVLFNALAAHGILDDTIVVVNGDHGETLYEHECWFDHHGLYDNVLHVPLILRYPPRLPGGVRVAGYNQHQDLVPTLLELAGLPFDDAQFDGRSLLPIVRGARHSHASELYLTECTWMRKHGWRTPEWKLMVALEPDFHGKPPVELYRLTDDPDELHNLAGELPDVAAFLRARMEAWIEQRCRATGLPAPILDQGDWHGHAGVGAFTSSQQAYDTLHIGDPGAAQRLQAGEGQ